MNPFAHISAEDFASAVGALDSAIPGLSDSQIRAGMARLVALVQDSHTSIWIDSASRSFPFKVSRFENGWFLTGINAINQDKLGYKLTALGGLDTESLIDAVAPYISHDNRASLVQGAERYLSLEDVLSAAGLLTARGTLQLQLVASDGSAVSLELSAGGGITMTSDNTPANLPLYRQRPSEAYWYQYDTDNRLLYVRYRLCAEQPGRPSVAFWQEVLAALDQNPVDRLVIDFRDNPGGVESLFYPLAAGLQERLPRFGNPTRGYGLINRGTFSSALLNVLPFKEMETVMELPFVRVFGEPTGGNPNAFGNVYSFQLPNSGLVLRLSTRYFGSMFKEESLQPDVLIPLRSEQYFKGQDPVMDAVLADRLR